MTNGWTGGQYSLYRAIFGTYLFAHFVTLLPWGAELFSNGGVLPSNASPFLRLFPNVLAVTDAPVALAALITIGAIASIGLCVGLYDRTAALVIGYILACLFGRNPQISNPSLPFVGWLLLAHTLLPPSPYGSWSARTRTDPRGGWHMPTALFAAAWVVMSVGYTYSGYTKLVGGALGLELTFAPLALFRRARPWIWTAMVGLQLGRMVLVDSADLSSGMVILHLFTFDPRWVANRWSERRDHIFYDGTCGLCHRATRFVLSEDRSGAAFRFAPLQGDTFAAAIARERQPTLPDSIVVRTEDGQLFTRSDAVIYVLQRLGGLWRAIAWGMSLVPLGLRNSLYDFIARIRYRLFARAETLCPVLPADLRSRFQG